jgi:hypothetical protein
MVIVKNRNGGTANWYTWQKTFSSATRSYVYLDGTAAVDNTTYNMWGASGHNSTTLGFTVGTSTLASANEVAYVFAEIAGYSAFGSYTGNGSTDGPFIYTGFRPRWLMIKSSSSAQPWIIVDTSRNTYNQAGDYLQPNSTAAENGGSAVSTATADDILSNGFKLRNNASSSGYTNASGQTYIYAAFAENPFKYSNAR